MGINTRFALLTLLTSFIVGCNPDKKTGEQVKQLDLDYPPFNNLTAIADCVGPSYNYVTIVHSTDDGYVFFRQEHENRDNFTAVIPDGQSGFQLNDSLKRLDSLSDISVEIIKGHEFHKIHMRPDQFFDQLSYTEDQVYQNKNCERFEGVDRFKNPVKLYYQRDKRQLAGLVTLNPMDTTEKIEVIYQEWMNMEFGAMARKVDIIQGGKDVYQFNFREVMVDDPGFERVAVSGEVE